MRVLVFFLYYIISWMLSWNNDYVVVFKYLIGGGEEKNKNNYKYYKKYVEFILYLVFFSLFNFNWKN